MSEYKVLQVRANVKSLIEEMAQKEGVSQSGLVAALMYTLDGRQNHGRVELDWPSVKNEYPAPIRADRGEWKKSTKRFKKVLDQYLEVSLLEAAEEAQVDVRLLWTILCFLYSRDDITEEGGGMNLQFDETIILLGIEERAQFDKAWDTFQERQQQRRDKRQENK